MNHKSSPASSPHTPPPTSKKKTAPAPQDKTVRRFHENQQLIIYLFVSATIVTAWVLGALQFSFTYVFALVALVFVVWRGKVIKRSLIMIRVVSRLPIPFSSLIFLCFYCLIAENKQYHCNKLACLPFLVIKSNVRLFLYIVAMQSDAWSLAVTVMT